MENRPSLTAEATVDQAPLSIEQAEFEANIDYYIDTVEAGQEIWLVRDGISVARLLPAGG